MSKNANNKIALLSSFNNINNLAPSKKANNIQKGKLSNNLIKENKEKDMRLYFTLFTLGLDNLINYFNEKNIKFIDLLILSKDSMKELQLELYQRNRIYNFSNAFTKFAKNYTIDEIIEFFENNKQFLINRKIFDEKIKNKFNFENNTNNNINNKNIEPNKIILLKEENKNNDNNYETPKHKDNNNIKLNKKISHSTNKKSHRGKNIIKNYLLIKKDVDDFLNKLNKQKEDTQYLSFKYGKYIKKINPYERNEDDIMISEEKNNNKKLNIDKLIEKINFLENKKMSTKGLEHINQIKNYIIEKKYNLTMEEVFKLENEIEKIIELNIKKENLINNLYMKEKEIDEIKNQISNE